MTCVREQILKAFAEQLGKKEIPVQRNRDSAVASFPMLIVLEGNQRSDHSIAGRTGYTASVIVEGYVQSDSTDNLGAAINDLYANTVKYALDNPSLGGLCNDIREGELEINIDAEGSKPMAAFRLSFEIDYWTKPKDPFTVF